MQSIILSLALLVLGLTLITWYKKISNSLFKMQLPWLKLVFGYISFIEKEILDAGWLKKLYGWAVIFGGIILLLMSYALYFGPIKL